MGETSEGKFMNESYIFPFFWLHGEDEQKLREYVKVINEAGCTAFCVESRPHPDFCGDKWWKDMDIIIDEAKERGMRLWILDDSHFPTGFANGSVMKAPNELRRQSVYTHVFPVREDQKTFSCNVRKVMKQIPSTFMGKIMSMMGDQDHTHVFTDNRLLAVSVKVKGKDEPVLLFDAATDGRLHLELPAGSSKVYVTFLTRNAGIHKSYINMLDRESCRILIDTVYEAHYAHYADEFGKTILGFFSDEPEIGNGVYFNNEIKMGTDFDFPWSRELEAVLPQKLGKNWKALLPLLWDADGNENRAATVRFTYMDAVTRLVEECFSRQIGSWCSAHGVEYIGHVIEDGNAHARTANSLGHYFRGLSGQHMAGIDDIGGQVLPFEEDAPAEGVAKLTGGRDGEFYHFMLGKLASSMAAIQPEKQGRAMCEIFGNYGWGEGPRMEKYLADHFMVQGINHFVPHAFSPKAYPDKDCPPHFYANGHNPQYRAFGNVISYMNRICALLSGGQAVLDTAVLYHADAEWTGEAMLDQKPARILMEHQIDFHILPSDVFEEPKRYQSHISEQGLSVNGYLYRTLIIPYAQYIRKETADAVDKLQDTGTTVVFLDRLPEGVIGGGVFPDFFTKIQVVKPEDLPEIIRPSITLSPENPRMRAFHYRKENRELYYFVNEDDKPYEGKIRIPAMKSGIAFDAWTGTTFVQQQEDQENATELYMKLRPSESRIFFAGAKREDVSQIEQICAQSSEGSLYEQLDQTTATILPCLHNWTRSTCRSIDYPHFGNRKEIEGFEDYSRTDRKFSGYIAYENQFTCSKPAVAGTGDTQTENGKIILEITDAGEDVEVFVNGTSAGIQILPPFLYDITALVTDGGNDIRIEVATTLERERGVNKKKQAPTGIWGEVYILRYI
jgi:hypothetical protein